MNRILALSLIALPLALGACTSSTTAAVTATVSKAQTDLQSAINLYGIAKGIAQVASVADPALAPILGGGIAALDPLVAQAQTALNAATVDATAIEALATAITAQANMLQAQAAPVVTVVPTAAAG